MTMIMLATGMTRSKITVTTRGLTDNNNNERVDVVHMTLFGVTLGVGWLTGQHYWVHSHPQ